MAGVAAGCTVVVAVRAAVGDGAASVSGATLVGVGVAGLAETGCDVATDPALFCITACAD